MFAAVRQFWRDLRPHRLYGAMGFTLLVLTAGTIGFAITEGWGLSDSLFMTVITISTVGYGEVQPLTEDGRVLAGFLIAGGVVTLAIWYALITAFLVETDLGQRFEVRRLNKKMENVRDHFIVCGVGRTGTSVLGGLRRADSPHVVVETDPDKLVSLRERDPGVLALRGNATSEEVLLKAGIRRAKGLVAALGADGDNVLVTLVARSLNPSLTIVAQARLPDSDAPLRKAGADHVVSPHVTGGARMASLVQRPHIRFFLDMVVPGSSDLMVEHVPIPPDSELDGVQLRAAEIYSRLGLLVVAVERHVNGEMQVTYNPGPEQRLHAGDELVVLGNPGQVERLRSFMTKRDS